MGVVLLPAGHAREADGNGPRRLDANGLCRVLGCACRLRVAGPMGRARHRPVGRTPRPDCHERGLCLWPPGSRLLARRHRTICRLGGAGCRHGQRSVRGGLRRPRTSIWPRLAWRHHRRDTVRRLREHGRLAVVGAAGSAHRLARRLLRLGRAEPSRGFAIELVAADCHAAHRAGPPFGAAECSACRTSTDRNRACIRAARHRLRRHLVHQHCHGGTPSSPTDGRRRDIGDRGTRRSAGWPGASCGSSARVRRAPQNASAVVGAPGDADAPARRGDHGFFLAPRPRRCSVSCTVPATAS